MQTMEQAPAHSKMALSHKTLRDMDLIVGARELEIHTHDYLAIIAVMMKASIRPQERGPQ